MQSYELSKYKTIQGFWQNLGISYWDIKKMPLYEYELYQGIMNIESQFADKNARKQAKQMSKKHV